MSRSVVALLLTLTLTCVSWCPSIQAIHSHDTQRIVLQQAIATFTHAVHLHQATLPACTPAQENCITAGQSGQTCDTNAGCQKCASALAGYTCQPTTRCLTSTPTTAIIAYPVKDGYKQPKQWAVGGPNNCAVTADCYFNQQACMNMGQSDDGEPSQAKCSAFASRPEYAQQECQFCQASVSDGTGSLTSSDCTHTPKAGCTDNSQDPVVTRSGTCPGSAKPAVFVATPAPKTTTTTSTTTTTTPAPKTTATTAPKTTTTTTTTTTTSKSTATTTAPEPVRRVSASVMTRVSMVSIIITGVMAFGLA